MLDFGAHPTLTCYLLQLSGSQQQDANRFSLHRHGARWIVLWEMETLAFVGFTAVNMCALRCA